MTLRLTVLTRIIQTAKNNNMANWHQIESTQIQLIACSGVNRMDLKRIEKVLSNKKNNSS